MMLRNRRRAQILLSISLTLVTMAATVLLGLQAGAATAVPPNFDTSRLPGNEAELAVAINPTNPQNVVTLATLSNAKAGLAEGVTFDGGNHWTSTLIGTGAPLGRICCDEQLAWDTHGNLWMTYLLNTNGNVLVALSTDGGSTFTKVASIRPVKPVGSHAVQGATGKGVFRSAQHKASGDQPSIAADGNSVWVSYTVFPSTRIQAVGAKVTGLGRFGSFGTPENVPTGHGGGDYGSTALGPDGQVMVSYQTATNGQGGAKLETALDPDGLGPKGFQAPVLLAHTHVGGFDFIPAQPDRSVDAEVNLAWDRSGGPHSGRVYAVWTAENPNESNNMDIMFQSSDDNGVTWTAPIRLNDDRTTNSQFQPSIAVDQTSGDIGVSWYDARNDLGSGGSGDTDGIPNDDVQTWATNSRDGGATFVPNFRVSAGTSNAADTHTSFDYGDYTAAAFQSGLFYTVWPDNSNSTGDNPDGHLHALDVYAARIAVP
jgi:hypothetical protein